MVTLQHECLHRVFQQDTELIVRTLHRIFGVGIEDPHKVTMLNVDLTEVLPIERRVDSVLLAEFLVESGQRNLVVIIESQTRPDRVKRRNWPCGCRRWRPVCSRWAGPLSGAVPGQITWSSGTSWRAVCRLRLSALHEVRILHVKSGPDDYRTWPYPESAPQPDNYDCDVLLFVVTSNSATARWARKPIRMGLRGLYCPRHHRGEPPGVQGYRSARVRR
jgi:hypothetical protein